ncbi:DUF6159 family protein [Amycolatopsis sp. CA-230715]|uniref:DUF6159 family protein n=1 Tax=Amycolatopsis sp. CA-230715 TaxID=2745196 RepID=UPI001C02C14B|nr:DUF6159 family protein [Amycolatopsis sp. CA-230715]QWF81750.1 hypothetical protein HUW46_05183 [Amycolatopsis sp. CA-230715]
MGYWSRAFAMLRLSTGLLRRHGRLAVFPVLAALTMLIVAAAFLTPAIFTAQRDGIGSGSIILAVACYLTTAMVSTSFRAALITQADVALRGGRPRVGAGFAEAGRRWGKLFAYSTFSATGSVLIGLIDSSVEVAGVLFRGVAGIAWRVLNYLFIPILVLEDTRIRDTPRRAGELLRRTWGENISGQVGLELLTTLVGLGGIGAILGTGAAIGGLPTLYVCSGLSCAWLVLVGVFASALSGVYQTVLYRYAADGTVPDSVDEDELRAVFTG